MKVPFFLPAVKCLVSLLPNKIVSQGVTRSLSLRGNRGLRKGSAPFDESCNDLIDDVWMRNGAHVVEPFKFYELDVRESTGQ